MWGLPSDCSDQTKPFVLLILSWEVNITKKAQNCIEMVNLYH